MSTVEAPRIVLHVGAHKTGTSLVQKFLRDRQKLCARHDLTYIGRKETNTLIGWGKVPVRQPEMLRTRLEQEAARSPRHTMLISHENSLGRAFIPGEPGIYPTAKRCAEGLRVATDGLDVRVVFYVRTMADFAESYYLQTVHEGGARRFDEWVAELDPTSWRWQPVVDVLDEVFGPARVLIGDFNEIADGQESYLHRFLLRAGLTSVSPSELRYRRVRNASVSARGLALALDVNPLLRKDREEPHEMRRFVQKYWSNLSFERARPMPEHLRASLGAGDYTHLVERARLGVTRRSGG